MIHITFGRPVDEAPSGVVISSVYSWAVTVPEQYRLLASPSPKCPICIWTLKKSHPCQGGAWGGMGMD